VRVVRTTAAQADIDAADAWWRTHRDEQDIFALELEEATLTLQRVPNAGRPVRARGLGPNVRSIVLPKTEKTIYYRVDTEKDQVEILRVYGSRRRRRPKLG
jgi:plasmid stabilization system protein ParE